MSNRVYYLRPWLRLDARLLVALLEHLPNHRECNAASKRRGNNDSEANIVGCWLHGVKGERIYTLPLNLGIHNIGVHV